MLPEMRAELGFRLRNPPTEGGVSEKTMSRNRFTAESQQRPRHEAEIEAIEQEPRHAAGEVNTEIKARSRNRRPAQVQA